TSTSGAPEVQISLTSLKPGSDEQIVVGGSAIPDILLDTTQIFTAGTTTIQTLSTNTSGDVNGGVTGSISLISGDVVVNGVDIGALAATPVTNTPEQNAQLIVGLINAKTDLTGVTAFTDGSGFISLKSTARDIILTGQTVADGLTAASATFGGGANTTGLFTGMNRAKNATILAGTTTDVFDSLGAQHTVGLDFVSDYDVVEDASGIVRGTRDNGVWNWAATADEPDVAVLSSDGLSNTTNVPLRTVDFNENGLLKNFNGIFTLNFLNTDAVTSTSIFNFNTNLSPNVEQPQPLTVDVGTVNDTDGLTQFSGPVTLTVADQDGYGAGDLSSFTFSPDGTVRGVFTNGQILALGRLALASFINESGLMRGNLSVGGGGNVYQESPNSGNPLIGVPQGGGNGSVIGGALEGSNVDLAEQFTDMIVTQRAFQANSRTITTADEMLQEILSLRR
ncbi:MAG TPA: flagellar hook-basal body complex protein, partial [Roseimicrobium sp.]|nr:flagellar hook-basal body complex protein [Roseimicrobium sp.]